MKKLTVLFFLFLLISQNLLSQWQPVTRLTNNPAVSYLYLNGAWTVAAYNNYVHVVWIDNRDGHSEVYYKQSTNKGVNWGADTRLTYCDSGSYNPSIAVSNSTVHVTWFNGCNNTNGIFYKQSTDNGTTWKTDIQLSYSDSAFSYQTPSIAASGSAVHIIWTIVWRVLNGFHSDNYYLHSTNAGINWSAKTRLSTSDTVNSMFPSIAVYNNIVHAVWHRGGNNMEIYYKRSTNNGVNWGSDTRLTYADSDSWYPCIAVNDRFVNVVWGDRRDGDFEIFYKRSTDYGVTWENDIKLTNNSNDSWNPSISVSGSAIHVIWDEYHSSLSQDIYYKRSTDFGVTWGTDTCISAIGSSNIYSEYSCISVSGTYVHVIWDDKRDGNWEIYYKQNPTGNPIGIEPFSNIIPNKFLLYQNYPNPFNPGTVIEFDIPERTNTKLAVYDAAGKEVITLVNKELNAGSYRVNFNGTSLSSGMYFYRLTADNYSETRRMVFIK